MLCSMDATPCPSVFAVYLQFSMFTELTLIRRPPQFFENWFLKINNNINNINTQMARLIISYFDVSSSITIYCNQVNSFGEPLFPLKSMS